MAYKLFNAKENGIYKSENEKMNKMFTFLFPFKEYSTAMSMLILGLRLLFGGLMMWHGIMKIVNFDSLVLTFPDPLSLGHKTSLVLAIFAEAFCSLAVVAGAFYRLALIPLLFTMAIALFVVHNGQAFVYKELAFIYFVVYVMIYMTGAGGYSLDDVIAQRLNHNTAADSSSEG